VHHSSAQRHSSCSQATNEINSSLTLAADDEAPRPYHEAIRFEVGAVCYMSGISEVVKYNTKQVCEPFTLVLAQSGECLFIKLESLGEDAVD
jgi:hypothetical protein